MRAKSMAVIGAVLSIINIARGNVAYFNGPAFAIPDDSSAAATLDLNGDGTVDFIFSSGGFVCTGDYPLDFCSGDYFIEAMGGNLVLQGGPQGTWEAEILTAGTTIGGAPPAGAVWTNDPYGGSVAEAYFGNLLATNPGPVWSGPLTSVGNVYVPVSSWGGPLAAAGRGYIGVAIAAQDGMHYGWVHAWLPSGSAFTSAPTVVDWAYETWPNTPIVAGAVPLALLATPQALRPGNLRLRWESLQNAAYQVQFKGDLNTPIWTNLDLTVIGAGATTAVDVPINGSGAGFYRIVQAGP